MRDRDKSTIFDCATSIAVIITEQCDALVEMCDYIEERVMISRRISSFESNADDVFHNLGLYMLENKLMTDPDANLLFEVVRKLEAITDAFEEVANSLVRYNITESGESLQECATALYGASQMAYELLINIRDKAPSSLILRDLSTLDRFKSKYCQFYDEAILELFTEPHDPIDIIKTKAIYDAFKDIFDDYEEMTEACYRYVLSYL